MKNLLKIKVQILMLFIGICFHFNSVYAAYDSHLQGAIDGTNTTILIWHTIDSTTGNFKVQAAVGNGVPVISDLSDPINMNAFDNNILATSSSVVSALNVARAAVVWRGRTASGRIVIQATSLRSTDGNWNIATTLSATDGSERPDPTYEIDISDDGTIISVTWVSKTPLNAEIIRRSISTDGGQTWTGPTTIATL